MADTKFYSAESNAKWSAVCLIVTVRKYSRFLYSGPAAKMTIRSRSGQTIGLPSESYAKTRHFVTGFFFELSFRIDDISPYLATVFAEHNVEKCYAGCQAGIVIVGAICYDDYGVHACEQANRLFGNDHIVSRVSRSSGMF